MSLFADLQLPTLEVKGKTVLLVEGQVATQFYVVRQGCVRIWLNHKGKDLTGQFFEEGEPVVSLESFLTGSPSKFTGVSGRPMTLTPGLTNKLIYQLFIKSAGNAVRPVAVEEKLADNDVLPLLGGIKVVHTPGHSAGHVALLLQSKGVLIAADLCAHVLGLAYSTLYEDRALGQQSILKAAALPFDTAVFGHGGPLPEAAHRQLREKFA